MANWASIKQKVAKSAKVQNTVYKRAQNKVKQAQKNLLKGFENHLITKEIDAGELASNTSETLYGLDPSHGGNLFSFIGFYAGDDPLADIRTALKEEIVLNKKPKIDTYKTVNNVQITYKVSYPSFEELEELTPYPKDWRSGSWLYGIEHGIFGLSYYIYDEEFAQYEQSRSQTALEAKDPAGNLVVIRGNSQSKPSKYISALLKQFVKDVKSQV